MTLDSKNSKYFTEFRLAPESRKFDLNWKDKLKGQKLRFFSPNELLQLFGFIELENVNKKIKNKNQKRSRFVLENNIDDVNSLNFKLKADDITNNDDNTHSDHNDNNDNNDNNNNNNMNIKNDDDLLFFPANITNRKCYELIGNSLSVTVVSHLLEYLFLSTFIDTTYVDSRKYDTDIKI